MGRRYLLIKVVCETSLSDEQLLEALTNSVRKYFGEIGLARIDPRLIRFDHNRSTAIVSCSDGGLAQLESAVALISQYLEIPLAPLVLRVSGTIKGLRKPSVR